MIELIFALQLIASPTTDEPAEPEKISRATQWATDTGTVAGGASFCAIDEEVLEGYIASAQSKIASIAADDVDLVVAKIEFSNVYSAASAREPLGGCENFGKLFAHESAKLD